MPLGIHSTLVMTLAILCTASSQSFAWQQENGIYIWDFLSGQDWPAGYNQNTGKPDNLIYSYNDYPHDFFQRISNALPESYVNEAFLTEDDGANISLKEEADVFITFIHEGAGYKNSFGYFTFDKNNPPTSPAEIREKIIFPNLSYPHLTNGHRLKLGTFPAGTSIGFFIAANGFSYYTGVKERASPYYYSLKGLNPEPNETLRQHNVLLYDDAVKEVIIGFEDLPRTWGDNDFNDAVFSVKLTPDTALDTTELAEIPNANDSDADGVPDNQDEYPNDYNRAFSSYYPSATEYVTLAFEDNWPSTGDYDLNDLVVSEQLRIAYNSNNQVTGFTLSGAIEARGASIQNGFALRLLHLPSSILGSANLTIAGKTYTKNAEALQSDLVITLWQDSHVFTSTNEADRCQHFNTIKECSKFDAIPFTLDVRFTEFQYNLTHQQFDFFIFQTNYRGREVHFADYPPTDLFDHSQFGKYDDTSDSSTGRYFRNRNNLPWAIKIPQKWRYPREYIDVVWAYPDYEKWVESSGKSAQNWHTTSNRESHYY